MNTKRSVKTMPTKGLGQKLPTITQSLGTVLAKMKEAFDIDEKTLDRYVKSGLLPLEHSNYILMARFLSHVVLRAQDAHRLYGVPASLLIAKAAFDSGWDGNEIASSWFVDQAEQLSLDRRFEVAQAMAKNPVELIRNLRSSKFWDSSYCGDIESLITDHHLQDCDYLKSRS